MVPRKSDMSLESLHTTRVETAVSPRHRHESGRRSILRFLCIITIALSGKLSAQVALKIQTLDTTSFPAIAMKILVEKNGMKYTGISAADFKIMENGIPQPVLSLACPGDGLVRLSIGLLLDRSESMALKPDGSLDPDSTKLREAKRAVRTFLDFLDPVDEAALFSFSSPEPGAPFFTIDGNFTHDIAALKGSLASIRAGGGTRLWQAVSEAAKQLQLRSGRRILIVVSDGKSEADYSYRAQAIQYAIDNRISVFAIGLGADVDTDGLRALASATGGRFYFAPDENALQEIFRTVALDVITDECVLRYLSSNNCLEGSRRDVEIGFSQGVLHAVADTSYTVANAPNVLSLSLPDGYSYPSNTIVSVPVYLKEFVSTLAPISYTCTVTYDTAVWRFVAVDVQGTISGNGKLAATEQEAGRIRISLNKSLPTHTAGALFNLFFNVRPLRGPLVTTLALADVVIDQGCPTTIVVKDGSQLLLPCSVQYTIGSAPVVVAPGSEFELPVRIQPSLWEGAIFAAEFTLTYDVNYLTMLEVKSLSGLQVSSQMANGRTAVLVQGSVRDSSADLVMVKFRSSLTRKPVHVPVVMADMSLTSQCLSGFALRQPVVTIDGVCDPLVVRRQPLLFSVSPTPVREALQVAMTLSHEADVNMTLFDRLGKPLAIMLHDLLPAGEHLSTINVAHFSEGAYFICAEAEGKTTVKPVMVIH
jgi:hypothetical protein